MAQNDTSRSTVKGCRCTSAKTLTVLGVVLAGLWFALYGLRQSDAQTATPAQKTVEVDQQLGNGWPGMPAGVTPPMLHPEGVQLETRSLADGVYALLSNKGAIDNNGFIVGERGVLAIDAHISGVMAEQILDAIRRVTDKPILYLVNTNYHGDHTFGNYAFPSQTTIIAHRNTAEKMKNFEHEKKFLLQTVKGDTSVYGDAKLRLPDVVFDRYMRIDLGGREVELYHFGPGNTSGDVVVYEPNGKIAFTGNLIVGTGSIPPMFEYGAATYLQTLTNLRSTLNVKAIVPGHLRVTDGTIVTRYIRYCGELINRVHGAIREGKTLDQVLADAELGAEYLPPPGSAAAKTTPLWKGFHRLNVIQTYRELTKR